MNTQSNTQPKFDLYQEVTDKIIAALEQGTAPWLKPWDSVKGALTGKGIARIT